MICLARFGFEKHALPRGLSLALGSLAISPLKLAQAYCVFANGGYLVNPFVIERIEDEMGEILLEAHPKKVCQIDCDDKKPNALDAPRVIPRDIAFLMNVSLREVVTRGTAKAARVLNREDIAGKTGTTNQQVDAWFAGYNSKLVTTVWVGYDNPKSLHEYAAQLALPIWIDFMKTALNNTPQIPLELPENVVSVRINPKTGLLAPSQDTTAIEEYFREEEIPSEQGISESYEEEHEHLF